MHVVLKMKRNADVFVERVKTRIVTGKNYQIFRTDYMKIYAPVVLFTAVRMI